MNTYRGVEVKLDAFLILASRPGRFTPGERVSGTHLIGGWVDPYGSKVRKSRPCPNRELNR